MTNTLTEFEATLHNALSAIEKAKPQDLGEAVMRQKALDTLNEIIETMREGKSIKAMQAK